MLPIALSIFIYQGGLSYVNDADKSDQNTLPLWCFAFAAFAGQWFSWFDMMDG